MMKSRIASRVFAVLSQAAVSLLLCSTLALAQEKPSGTTAKAKIELTTDPSPAQKGGNAVHVKLTDSEGKPIAGAQVTVTFFMAAMPSMNMPEMKTVVKGVEKGPGVYEGKGDLGSGGLWDTTVTAQQNGKTIATKKLTVKATGGM